MRCVRVVAADANGVTSRTRRVESVEGIRTHDEGRVGREGQVLSQRGLLVDIVSVRGKGREPPLTPPCRHVEERNNMILTPGRG